MKKKATGARRPKPREVPNDGRPTPGRRTSGPSGRDPLKDGATTTVATGPGNHAVHLLQSEHRTVAALFDRVRTQPGVLADIRRELERHARLEEEIFYPALAAAGEEAAVGEARAHHRDMRKALGTGAALDRRAIDSLRGAVERHVEFEESVVFAAALRVLDKVDLVELAERMEQRNRQLGGTLPLARPRRGKGVPGAP